MKATFLQIFGSWAKSFVSGVLTFALLQYSHGFSFTSINLWDFIGAGIGALLPMILKWVQGTNVWGQTFIGGVVKNILAVLIALLISKLGEGYTMFTINWADFINTGIASALPAVLNWLNPNDNRYGLKEKVNK